MLTSPDFKELLSILARFDVRYLVVGGYAVMRYTEPRFTKDLDIWISPDEQNAKAVFDALKEFGAPLANLTPRDFTQQDYFYQMGKPPFRLDVMMSIPGVEFEEAWVSRQEMHVERLSILFISRDHLLRSKLASGRPQDLLDVQNLRKAAQVDGAESS